MIDDSGVNIATTKLLGQFAGSQVGVGGDIDIVDNQLGEAAVQQSIGSFQYSRGVESYPPLSGGLGGSPADFGSMLNLSGLGENMPTGLYDMGRASDGVQVGLSLLPSVRHSDQLREHRECP